MVSLKFYKKEFLMETKTIVKCAVATVAAAVVAGIGYCVYKYAKDEAENTEAWIEGNEAFLNDPLAE